METYAQGRLQLIRQDCSFSGVTRSAWHLTIKRRGKRQRYGTIFRGHGKHSQLGRWGKKKNNNALARVDPLLFVPELCGSVSIPVGFAYRARNRRSRNRRQGQVDLEFGLDILWPCRRAFPIEFARTITTYLHSGRSAVRSALKLRAEKSQTPFAKKRKKDIVEKINK